MKAVIFNNVEDFNNLQKTINDKMIDSIQGYFADKWAEPFYSVDKTKIACVVDAEGLREEIIADIIKDYDVVEILTTDTFWYPELENLI